MTNPRTLYWDTSCFLCLLNEEEHDRRVICEDILGQARLGNVQIWTSTWTIVEVIRPGRPGIAPLPEWAIRMIEAVPEGRTDLEMLWQRHQNRTPAAWLAVEQIEEIQAMFESYTKKIELDEIVADKAVTLAREHGLRPGDAVHAASAIIKRVSALQRWDRDFERVSHLINVEEPSFITGQGGLFALTNPARGAQVPELRNEEERAAIVDIVAAEVAPLEVPTGEAINETAVEAGPRDEE